MPLDKPDGLTANPPDLLVLPNAGVVPAEAVFAIERYLRTGGDLIALRTPLSLNAPVRIAGKWVNKDDYLSEPSRHASAARAVRLGRRPEGLAAHHQPS